MKLRTYNVVFASTLLLTAALKASAPDNRPEVRQARLTVIREIEEIYAAVRNGIDLNQLSPMELALLRGDTGDLLAGSPPEIQRAAADAAGDGLGSGVLVDNTHGVLTAWRYAGSTWVHVGYSDRKDSCPKPPRLHTQCHTRAGRSC